MEIINKDNLNELAIGDIIFVKTRYSENLLVFFGFVNDDINDAYKEFAFLNLKWISPGIGHLPKSFLIGHKILARISQKTF